MNDQSFLNQAFLDLDRYATLSNQEKMGYWKRTRERDNRLRERARKLNYEVQ